MVPTRIGQISNGGYFAGLTQSGKSITAIIVSPKSSGVVSTALQFLVNPAPVFEVSPFVSNITYYDWKIPTLYELDVCYYNFKPGYQINHPSCQARTDWCKTAIPPTAYSKRNAVIPDVTITLHMKHELADWFSPTVYGSIDTRGRFVSCKSFINGQCFLSISVSAVNNYRLVRRLTIAGDQNES